jgi:hypothetical protein
MVREVPDFHTLPAAGAILQLIHDDAFLRGGVCLSTRDATHDAVSTHAEGVVLAVVRW